MNGIFFEKGNALFWRAGKQSVKITALTESVIRVQAGLRSDFTGLPSALMSEEEVSGTCVVKDSTASLSCGNLRAEMSDYGRISFFKAGEDIPFLEEPDWKPVGTSLYPRGREYTHKGGGLYRIECRFNSHRDERFYGLGQHRHGLLDQKGAVIDLMQRNAEVSIPFLVSSRLYGFLWNNPGIGRVELAANHSRWTADASPYIDYVVIDGNSYAEILKRYTALTGRAPEFPEWAAGFWQCKLRYTTQEQLLSVAREYKRRGLPLSVIVVDFFHWTKQGEWRWDPECWPDPAAMTAELEGMGVKLMVSVWPTVNPKSENASEMKSRGLLIDTNNGLDVVHSFVDTHEAGPVHLHYYDATNPQARGFLWERIKEHYYDAGVRVFWLDACEPELNPYDHANLRFEAGTGLAVANCYPLMHAEGFYEGMKAAGQKGICNLARSGWAGIQRCGTAVWSGDIPSDWETFRAQIKAGLNMMMSGVPWWTTDIGGFHGGNVNDPDFRELLLRWFQYGTFCPLFRLHGVREPRTGGLDETGPDNEVWSYGKENYEILKELLFLRERMRPYIMQIMKEASATGLPPMRPLFFDYADDPRTYEIEDQFLFGPDLIVCPVTEAGMREREVYLPGGTEWRRMNDDRLYRGGSSITVSAPLDEIPVFISGKSKTHGFDTPKMNSKS
jgi:alpha-D-xyloside xylohydrolase